MQDRGLLSAAAAQRVQTLVAQGEPLESAVLAADGVSEESLLRFLASALDIGHIHDFFNLGTWLIAIAGSVILLLIIRAIAR